MRTRGLLYPKSFVIIIIIITTQNDLKLLKL